MELLLMSEEKVSSSEAASAFGTFERLLLGMRPLMALQMFQASKGAHASCAYMGPRLIRLWGRQ